MRHPTCTQHYLGNASIHLPQMSKAAVDNFVRTIQYFMPKYNMRIYSVNPGHYATGLPGSPILALSL